jgi:acetyl/propionyl-CoA carboxylase alpha subunit
VIVVGTRDCSLQRRHQKLVEEAPAPFLTDEQRGHIHDSAKAICREAGYHGAGTVEYLVGADGTISFLEVNTRLQVEHPVTEETAGIDLVREQFRIADGEKLRFTADPRRAATRSSSASTARTRAAASCPRRARSPRCGCPPGPACASTPASRPAASSAATSTRCWPR